MFHLNIDNSIVIIFLLITLVFGLCASRNIKDIAEYAIRNKVLGSGIVAITILATYITGSKGIGYAGYVFDDGILPMLPAIFCGVIFCFLFIIFFILPHIKYFDGCLTTAELMGQIYGIKTRFTVGILGSFYTTTLVILQIIWFGDIAVLLGMSKLWGGNSWWNIFDHLRFYRWHKIYYYYGFYTMYSCNGHDTHNRLCST